MGQLIPIELEHGTIIQIEATETTPTPSIGQPQFSDPNNPKPGLFPTEPPNKSPKTSRQLRVLFGLTPLIL